jgi:predicted nucleotidyltransferase
MLTSNQIIKLINENQSNVQKFGVKRIALFGSFLKNM